jgi:hypothetical protein
LTHSISAHLSKGTANFLSIHKGLPPVKLFVLSLAFVALKAPPCVFTVLSGVVSLRIALSSLLFAESRAVLLDGGPRLRYGAHDEGRAARLEDLLYGFLLQLA